MAKDTRKALARLEAELLRRSDAPASSSCPHHCLKAYNSDTTDEDLETYSEAVRVPPRKHRFWILLLIVLCLTAGILAFLAWKAALS